MQFLIVCRADVDTSAARSANRRAHLEYMLQHREKLLYGGAMVAGDSDGMTGMVCVIDVSTREDAERFIQGEPYNRSGMFAEVRVDLFSQRMPEPQPGFLERELERERALQGGAAPQTT